MKYNQKQYHTLENKGSSTIELMKIRTYKNRYERGFKMQQIEIHTMHDKQKTEQNILLQRQDSLQSPFTKTYMVKYHYQVKSLKQLQETQKAKRNLGNTGQDDI